MPHFTQFFRKLFGLLGMTAKKCPLHLEVANMRSEMRIKELMVSTAFLLKNQAYRAYSVVVYNNHEKTLENIPEEK